MRASGRVCLVFHFFCSVLFCSVHDYGRPQHAHDARAERAGRVWVGPDTPYSSSQSHAEVALASGHLCAGRRIQATRGDGRAAGGVTRLGLCMPGEFRSHCPSKNAPSCSRKRASITPPGRYNQGRTARSIKSAQGGLERENRIPEAATDAPNLLLQCSVPAGHVLS